MANEIGPDAPGTRALHSTLDRSALDRSALDRSAQDRSALDLSRGASSTLDLGPCDSEEPRGALTPGARAIGLDPLAEPVFLVGSMRSCTTLLSILLNHHPQLAFLNEFRYAVAYFEGGAPPPLERYRELLAGDRIFRQSGFEWRPGLEYQELVHDFLRQFFDRRSGELQSPGSQSAGSSPAGSAGPAVAHPAARDAGPRKVGASVHEHFGHLPELFPDARYVYIVRDPRDVARSILERGWQGTFYHAARMWVDAHEEYQILRKKVGGQRILGVRAESLIADPEHELERICDFIDLPYTRDMLDIEGDSTYRRPDPRLRYQWLDRLEREDVQLVEAAVGDLLTHYGYEPSGFRRLELSPWALRRLDLENRLGRFRAGLRRFGWTYAGRALARRLPGHRLERKLERRLSDIELTLLQ